MAKLASCATVALLSLIACGTALATTHHVKTTSDSGSGSLRQTIASASPGDVIVVPAGTYKLLAGQIVINKKLQIDGAGPAATIISGNDAHRVFSLVGAAGVKITSLAIVHGRLAQPDGSESGAGVLIDAASSLTLDHLRVTNNAAVVSGNTSQLAGVIDGGAISSTGALTLLHSFVDHNSAKADGGGGGHSGGVVDGGAIYNEGTLSVTGTSISHNLASVVGNGSGGGGVVDGGAIYNPTADLTLSNSMLSGNVARADGGSSGGGGVVDGGGIYNNNGNLTLTRTRASGNLASSVGHGSGGGGVVNGGVVFNNGKNLSLTDVAANNNVDRVDGGSTGGGGVVDGGAIYHNGQKLTLIRTSASGNTTSSTGGAGGGGGVVDGAGVYDNSSSPYVTTITSSHMGENSANVDGGSNGGGGVADGVGLYLNGNQITMSATTVDGNHGTARGFGSGGGGVTDGGGIYDNVPGTLTNVTVSRNSANAAGGSSGGGGVADGGGIYLNDVITMVNSTLAGNSVQATGTPAGVFTGGDAAGSASVHAKNTIVTGGSGAPGGQNCSAPLTSDGHNIDSRDQCGFHATGDRINTNPLLAPLANNGGPVPTQALLPHSPALNTGQNAGCPTADARGAPRPAFGVCDIGAFEAQPAPVIAALQVMPTRFRAQNSGPTTASKHPPKGATVRYTDSVAALTKFTIFRGVRGIRKGKLCVGAPKHHRHHRHLHRCTRYVPVGSFSHQDGAGSNRFHFSGRLNGHRLPPGGYRLTAVPSLWAVSGGPRSVRFTIVT